MVNELKVEFTDKQVIAWGGMKLMKDMLDSIGIKEMMKDLDLPERGSNRSYSAIQIIECFWVSIWIGAGRFSHSAYLRYDKVLQKIFGWKQAPSQSTYSRFFQKFSWKRNTEVFVPIQKWFVDNLQLDNLTIDFDSSVITRYGEQEGSKVGFNQSKPGRPSHHPLMAFISETRMVANACADSGFYGHDFLKYLETERQMNYIIAVKMYATIKQELRKERTWWELKDGMEICEFEYQSPDWKKSRRMIAVRKNIDKLPKATGKLLLFDEPVGNYRYSLLVTNLNLPAEQI